MRVKKRGTGRRRAAEPSVRDPAIPRPRDPATLPVKVAARRVIRAPVQKVFALISRPDVQPRVTGLWLSVDPLERRPNQFTVHYRGYFAGVPLESVQRVTLQPPHRVEFRQTRGGLRALAGEYVLQPVEGGETELVATLEADVGIALISNAAAQRVLRGYAERLLDKVKLTAERDLPRAVRRPREEKIEAPLDRVAADGEAVPAAEVEEQLEPVPPEAAAAPVGTAPPATQKKRRRRRRRRPRQSSESSRSSGSTRS